MHLCIFLLKNMLFAHIKFLIFKKEKHNTNLFYKVVDLIFFFFLITNTDGKIIHFLVCSGNHNN